MASAAQIVANQANAQLSTGPVSVQGKARSARNRLRHGFRSQSVLLPGDDPAEYNALRRELEEHFAPEDLTDLRFIREMVDAEWRLRRARQYQEILLTAKIHLLETDHSGLDPIHLQALAYETLLRESSAFAQFARHETRFQSQYDRAFRGWCSYQHDLDKIKQRQAEAQLHSLFNAPLSVIDENEYQNLPDRTRKALSGATPTTLPAAVRTQAQAVKAEESKLTNEPNSTASDIPRSAPCPCGSGLKYKRCCGQSAPPRLGSVNPSPKHPAPTPR